MLVFSDFLPKLGELSFHSKGKIAQLRTCSSENWNLAPLCALLGFTGHQPELLCSCANQGTQVCYCRIKIYSDKSPSPLLSVHIFIRWFCGCCSALCSTQHLESFTCVICPQTSFCLHNLGKNRKLKVYFFCHDLLECSVVDGDGDYMQ